MLAKPSEFQASKANPGIFKESPMMREFGHIFERTIHPSEIMPPYIGHKRNVETSRQHCWCVPGLRCSVNEENKWVQMRSHRNFLPRAKPRNLFQRRRQMAACPELPSDGSVVACLHLWAWSDRFDLFVGLIRSVGLSLRNQIRLEWSSSILDALRFIVLCRCFLETKEEHTATQIVSYLRLQLGLNQIHNQQESTMTMSQKTSTATCYFAQNSKRLAPIMIINLVESRI